eukprot:TRINITY_DN26404_c0_g1_i1.p1 TRINITY_DN26404_c0_g1~~TRINITY_DN26404_c0_g1_i1.p1  ORF type:complete len:339 (+),score=64.36 TRINITY_DN26404_c0_g1_i1:32-1048(+)
MAAFNDVGEICSLVSCAKQDFLPFKCSQCEKKFCKDHFMPEAHSCEGASVQTVQTAISGSAQTRRCGAAGCRELLGPSNTVVCQRCRQEVCLRHRYEGDHQCMSLDEVVRAALLRAAEEIPTEERAAIRETLLKVFRNVLENPGNEKFRSLKKANALVRERLKHPASVAILRLCGFEDVGESYTCSPVADLTAMRKMVAALQAAEQSSATPAAQAPRPAGSGTRIVNGVIQRTPTTNGYAAASAPSCAPAAPAAAAEVPIVATAAAKRPAIKPLGAATFERRGASAEQTRKEQEDALREARAAQKQRYKSDASPESSTTQPKTGSSSQQSGDQTCVSQ